MSLTRRDLLKSVGALTASVTVPRFQLGQAKGKIPTRPYGKTGWSASIYSVGTAELPMNDEEAIRILEESLDGGVNYVDTAPSYMGSHSESVVGKVLERRRKDVFLVTKTLERSADGAYAEVKASLGRLRTGRADLLLCHAINSDADLDRILSASGTVKGLERAKKEGLIRFIGLSGHTRPEVVLKALDAYPFDAILIPLSPLDHFVSDFATEVVPKARKLGIGITGMKALKGIERARGTKFDPEPFLRYSMSLPVSTTVIGLRRGVEAGQNLRIAQAFKPMTAEEMRALEESVKADADVGRLWWKNRG